VQRLERSPTKAELAAEVNETEAQLTQIQKLGQLAKQKMITANLRLVVAVAKNSRWSNLEFLDLIEEESFQGTLCSWTRNESFTT
jgi:DNA-directed RNA polymerase sigma subunit (sigma70/sigma32)